MKQIAIDSDAITSQPLDLALLKQDLRITHSELDYAITTQYIPDAVAWAEGATHRAIALRAHRWIIDEFPYGACGQTLYLPLGRVTAVASVAYSSGGTITTLRGPTSGSPAGTDYQEDLRGNSARLMPPRGGAWPGVDVDVPSPVVVTFTAGWAAADLPADLRRALIVSVAHALELGGLHPSSAFHDIDLELRDKMAASYRVYYA